MVPGTRGYHLDAFLSPFESLRTIVRQWKRADAHRKQTGSAWPKSSRFQTGRLALPYKPEAAQGVTPEASAVIVPRRLRPRYRASRRRRHRRGLRRARQSLRGGNLRLGPRRSGARRRLTVEGLGQSRVPGPPV